MFADDGFGAAVDGAAVVGKVDDAVFVCRLWSAGDVASVLRVVVVVGGAGVAASVAGIAAIGGAVAVAVSAAHAVCTCAVRAFFAFEAVGAGAGGSEQGEEEGAKVVFAFHCRVFLLLFLVEGIRGGCPGSRPGRAGGHSGRTGFAPRRLYC